MNPRMTQACVEDVSEPIDDVKEVLRFLKKKQDSVPPNELNEYTRHVNLLTRYIKDTE